MIVVESTNPFIDFLPFHAHSSAMQPLKNSSNFRACPHYHRKQQRSRFVHVTNKKTEVKVYNKVIGRKEVKRATPFTHNDISI